MSVSKPSREQSLEHCSLPFAPVLAWTNHFRWMLARVIFHLWSGRNGVRTVQAMKGNGSVSMYKADSTVFKNLDHTSSNVAEDCWCVGRLSCVGNVALDQRARRRTTSSLGRGALTCDQDATMCKHFAVWALNIRADVRGTDMMCDRIEESARKMKIWTRALNCLPACGLWFRYMFLLQSGLSPGEVEFFRSPSLEDQAGSCGSITTNVAFALPEKRRFYPLQYRNPWGISYHSYFITVKGISSPHKSNHYPMSNRHSPQATHAPHIKSLRTRKRTTHTELKKP